MSKLKLIDKKFELIKEQCLNPDAAALSDKDRELMERWVDAARILDKFPVRQQAAAMLMTKYPDISRSTAYTDLKYASRLFNSLQTFDYDWWHQWLVNDIAKHINACREAGDRKNWATGHANLIKAIGDRPEEPVDPRRHEKKEVYLAVQINNNTIKLDRDKLARLQPGSFKSLLDALTKEITDEGATEIMGS